jgi:phosphate transport system substrate-binding protein
MKTFAIATVILGTASIASADPVVFRGSDTLLGATVQAISEAGLQTQLSYAGGGSGLGETGLRNATQGIAPMSRPISDAGINDLVNQGITPVQTVIGLDGVSLFVGKNEPVSQIDIATIRGIYTCAITDWSGVAGSGKSGPITAYRRDDLSGTTDVFRTLVGNGPAPGAGGLLVFGSCVTVLPSTEAIANITSTEASAIGYAGLSGSTADNKALAVALTTADPFIAPAEETIRDFSYPLARRLFINSVSGARAPSTAEAQLRNFMSNPDQMNHILVEHDFVTCDPDFGCP